MPSPRPEPHCYGSKPSRSTLFARSKRRCRAAHARPTVASAAGRTDFLDVLDAQRSVLAIEERLVLAREAELVQTINLFAALGGGWSPPVERTTADAR